MLIADDEMIDLDTARLALGMQIADGPEPTEAQTGAATREAFLAADPDVLVALDLLLSVGVRVVGAFAPSVRGLHGWCFLLDFGDVPVVHRATALLVAGAFPHGWASIIAPDRMLADDHRWVWVPRAQR